MLNIESLGSKTPVYPDIFRLPLTAGKNMAMRFKFHAKQTAQVPAQPVLEDPGEIELTDTDILDAMRISPAIWTSPPATFGPSSTIWPIGTPSTGSFAGSTLAA